MADKRKNNKLLIDKIATRQAEKIANMTDLKKQEAEFQKYRKILALQKKYK